MHKQAAEVRYRQLGCHPAQTPSPLARVTSKDPPTHTGASSGPQPQSCCLLGKGHISSLALNNTLGLVSYFSPSGVSC